MLYKKLISYIWPVTKKIPSEISGSLEVTWVNGKKVLDSKNANYSYGALQKLLVYGLSKIFIPPTSSILLLGLGGGSVINPLRKQYQHQGKITAVEIDKTIIQIAENEFGVLSDDNLLEIICQDAYNYVNQCQQQFDIVIIDLFIDNLVPDPFYSIKFWKQIDSILKPSGQVVFNAGIHVKGDKKIEALLSDEKITIQFEVFNNVQGTNTLIIGKKS